MPRRDPLAFELVTLPRMLLLVGTIALVAGVGLERRNLLVLGLGAIAWLAFARLSVPRLARIRCERRHPARIFEGEHVRVALRLAPPPGAAPVRFVEITDEFPASGAFTVRGLIDALFLRGRGGELVYRPRASRRRGLYVLGPVELAAADPTGLELRAATLDVFTNLIVTPRVVPLDRFRPYDTWTVRHLGERTLRHRGLSQEFLDVREYRPGDSPRHVHWPVSARHRTLYVKAFEDAVMTTVTIFLDLYRLSHSGLGEVTSEEALVSTAATLATVGIDGSHRVGLVGLNDAPFVIPPAAGPAQLVALLEALALARAGGQGDLAAAVREHLPLVERGGTVVLVVAATTSTPALEALAGELVLRGERVVVVVIDDRSYHPLTLEQQLRRVAQRPLDDVLAAYARHGADVFHLDKESDPRARLEVAADRAAPDEALAATAAAATSAATAAPARAPGRHAQEAPRP